MTLTQFTFRGFPQAILFREPDKWNGGIRMPPKEKEYSEIMTYQIYSDLENSDVINAKVLQLDILNVTFFAESRGHHPRAHPSWLARSDSSSLACEGPKSHAISASAWGVATRHYLEKVNRQALLVILLFPFRSFLFSFLYLLCFLFSFSISLPLPSAARIQTPCLRHDLLLWVPPITEILKYVPVAQ
jgi:hypothetical protein